PRPAWRRPRVPAPAAFPRPILRCLRSLPSIRTRTRLITTLTNNLTVTARTCSVGDPPTPRDSLPRRTLDEDMMRGTYHPVPLRAVRHKHPTPPPPPALTTESPAPTPALPRAARPAPLPPPPRPAPALPPPAGPRAGLLRGDLPAPARPRADLPPRLPVDPLPPAAAPP